MSNIDKQWLQQKIADMEVVRDEIPFGLDEDDSNTLAALRIALASLEAEAVSVFKIDHESSLIKHVKKVVSETNAPPAPVSVPDMATPQIMRTMFCQLDDSECAIAADVWNACRAAMLQGADGNPQVMNDHPETLPCPVSLEPGLKFGKGVATKILLEALQRRANYSAEIEVIKEVCGDIKDGDFLAAAKINGSSELVMTAYKLPANTPCKEAPEHIWLQTAGAWPENGEFSELTWCSDNQHPDDTLYVRADVVTGNSPVIPDGLRLALSNAGIAAPESDEMLAATCEKYIQELVTWVKDRKPFRSAAPNQEDKA